MSTVTPAAPPQLFDRLVDDAAVFPPGLSPVEAAVAQHAAWRASAVAPHLGPLLAPAASTEALVAALQRTDGQVPLGVIGRPGTPVGEVGSAVARLREARADVVSAEIAHGAGWRDALAWGLPVAVELPQDAAARDTALQELSGARAEGHEAIAKMRTQATADSPIPTAAALAAFISACVQARVPFKLTGGLHHAIASNQPSTTGGQAPEEQHGVLNVLLATDRALDGDEAEVASTLLSRDAVALVSAAGGLGAERAQRLREAFRSLGCCGVLDPLSELADLGLLDAGALR